MLIRYIRYCNLDNLNFKSFSKNTILNTVEIEFNYELNDVMPKNIIKYFKRIKKL